MDIYINQKYLKDNKSIYNLLEIYLNLNFSLVVQDHF